MKKKLTEEQKLEFFADRKSKKLAEAKKVSKKKEEEHVNS